MAWWEYFWFSLLAIMVVVFIVDDIRESQKRHELSYENRKLRAEIGDLKARMTEAKADYLNLPWHSFNEQQPRQKLRLIFHVHIPDMGTDTYFTGVFESAMFWTDDYTAVNPKWVDMWKYI